MMKTFLRLLLIILSLGAAANAVATICISDDFETFNSGLYGFSSLYGSPKLSGCSYPVSWSGEEYCIAHESGADADGSDAAHIIINEDSSQFQFGWINNNCSGWTDGDVLRGKVRIKYDDQYYNTEDHKVLQWGLGGYRFIMNGRKADHFPSSCRANSSSSTSFCSNHDGLGSSQSCTTDADCTESGVQYYCIPAQDSGENDGAWSLNHDIGTPCAGPVGSPSETTLNFPLDEWVWVQWAVKTGASGYIKIWVNNTDESEPNACTGSASDCPASSTFGYPSGTGPVNIPYTAWDGQVDLGHYWQNTESHDMGFLYGSFEMSRNEAFDAAWGPSGGDTENPTDPTGLSATAISSSQINLSWTASTDNVGVTGYNIERCAGASCVNFAQVDTAPSNSYQDTGLSPGTLYRYRVQAYDAVGNTSGYSSIDEDTTEAAATENTGLPFISSFETDDFSEWNASESSATSNISLITSGCVDGTYCTSITLVNGTLNDNYINNNFGDFVNTGLDKVESVWLTFYSKLSVDYIPVTAQSHKLAIINAYDEVSTARRYQVYVYVGPDGNYWVDHSDIDDWLFYGLEQNVGSPVSPTLGSWDKIKLYAQMNTPGSADGIVRMWINDTLKLEYTNVDLRESTTDGWGRLILSSYTSNSTGSGTQYSDNWLLSETDPDAGQSLSSPVYTPFLIQ